MKPKQWLNFMDKQPKVCCDGNCCTLSISDNDDLMAKIRTPSSA